MAQGRGPRAHDLCRRSAGLLFMPSRLRHFFFFERSRILTTPCQGIPVAHKQTTHATMTPVTMPPAQRHPHSRPPLSGVWLDHWLAGPGSPPPSLAGRTAPITVLQKRKRARRERRAGGGPEQHHAAEKRHGTGRGERSRPLGAVASDT